MARRIWPIRKWFETTTFPSGAVTVQPAVIKLTNREILSPALKVSIGFSESMGPVTLMTGVPERKPVDNDHPEKDGMTLRPAVHGT